VKKFLSKSGLEIYYGRYVACSQTHSLILSDFHEINLYNTTKRLVSVIAYGHNSNIYCTMAVINYAFANV